MNKKALEASLALWRRRHRWNQTMRARARKRGDQAAARRYGTRLGQAVIMIGRRKRQLAELAARKTVRQKAVEFAAQFVGTTENPAGSNRHAGTVIDRCQQMLGFDLRPGENGVPWCGCFAAYVLAFAGVKGITSRLASVALIEEDARAHRGPFRGWSGTAHGALRGDLAVIGGCGVHVEVITKVYPDGSADTTGGNTSPGAIGSQANGGGVWNRHRPAASIHGVAHVAFPN